jgi:hypothetical protein
MAATYLNIKDTGKWDTDTAANGSEVIAKGDDGVAGNDIILKGVTIDYDINVMTDDNATPGLKNGLKTAATYDYLEWKEGDIDQTGIENPEWKIKGVMLIRTEAEMKKFGRLVQLARTKGYKIITSDGSSITDYAMPLINYSQYDHGATTTIASINVRVVGFKVKHDVKKDRVDYTLTVKEIGSRDSP